MTDSSQVWTDKKIEELKKLWGKGLTTAEIGKKLNVSKNAVVGKSHRLGLKSRPSPIKAMPEVKKSIAKKATTKEIVTKKAEKIAPAEKIIPPKVATTPTTATKSKKKVEDTSVDIIDLKPGMCKWPSGDPKGPNFHFCGKPALDGKPYCAAHYAMAYTVKGVKEDKSKN